MDASGDDQVAPTPPVAEASSQQSSADASPVQTEAGNRVLDVQDRRDASEAPPMNSNRKKKQRSKAACPQHAAAPAWLPLALITATGVGLATAIHTLLKMQRRRNQRAQHERAFAQRFHMEASQPASTLLTDACLVVDMGVDVRESYRAPVIDALLAAGAICIGQSTHQPMLDDAYGTPLRNPAMPGAVVGGGCAGAAVLTGVHADVALAVDAEGELRVPAACCGLFCLRATLGALPMEGTAAATDQAALAMASPNPDLLLQCCKALGMPADSTKDIQRLIIAEDLFTMCGGPVGGPLLAASRRAGLHWAGQGQVATASLLPFIAENVSSLAAFRDPAPTTGADTVVLQALAAAAACACVPHDTSNDDAAASTRRGQAQAVCKEMAAAFAVALQEKTLLLLPGLAASPPPQGKAGEWAIHTRRLQSIVTLTGVPMVNIPVPDPVHGILSVSLLGLTNADTRVLAAAAKLAPRLASALQQAHTAASKAASSGTPSGAARPATPTRKERDNQARGSGAVEDARSRAEAHKNAGNEAFKSGAFDAAVAQYSAAIEAAPPGDAAVSVYYSNRAMAYLKLMEFDLAKSDCDASLKLSLNPKALLRRGTARLGLNDLHGARKDFAHVLALEPNNRQAREELASLEDMEATYGLAAT